MDVNINYLGLMNMLQTLKDAGLISKTEAQRKAAEAALPAASAELTEWKEDVLYQLLEKVTVLDEARIKVTFRSGVEIEQALEKDERSVTA